MKSMGASVYPPASHSFGNVGTSCAAKSSCVIKAFELNKLCVKLSNNQTQTESANIQSNSNRATALKVVKSGTPLE